MGKYCNKCGNKIGFLSFFVDGLCEQCYYEHKQKEQEDIEAKKIEERRKFKETKQELLRQKVADNKTFNKCYLTYSLNNLLVIYQILNLELPYSDIFKLDKKDNLQIISSILGEILSELPKNFNINDLKEVTTYRNSSKILENVSKKICVTRFNSELFLKSQLENYTLYSQPPRPDILDDTEENYMLYTDIYTDFKEYSNEIIINKSRIAEELGKNYKEYLEKLRKYNATYDEVCEQYINERKYYILSIYYEFALIILYLIAISKEIKKLEEHEELSKIYDTLKKEVHNKSYIYEKYYSIYNNLYKEDFVIEFSEQDIIIMLQIADEHNSIIDYKKDFINFENSILNITIEDSLNFQEKELFTSIMMEVQNNIIKYQDNLSFDEILDIECSLEKNILDIKNKILKEQARLEKERILNGELDKEIKMQNQILDYSNISNGYDFEKYVANLYSQLEYDIISITSKSGDQGADIIMKKDNLKYAVQVKFYNSPVGNKAIQEIVAAKQYYKTDRAMVVTNNFYTKSAIELANSNDVILVDKIELDKIIYNLK